jgi:hypothetical protein
VNINAAAISFAKEVGYLNKPATRKNQKVLKWLVLHHIPERKIGERTQNI